MKIQLYNTHTHQLGGDDQVPHMQLGRLLTPDPLNLRLKLQALSGDHTHRKIVHTRTHTHPLTSSLHLLAYNPQVHTSQHRGKGKFITSRAKSPNYSPSKYFPKEVLISPTMFYHPWIL